LERLLDRREGVERVELEEINVVRAEPPQAIVDRLREVKARRTGLVVPRPGAKAALGGDQHFIAAAFDCLPQNLFRLAPRVDISGVEHRQSRIEADVH
jgi:hypothetical protein